ncbi:MAG: hypothetical protein R3A79_05605 [Nannocystaceae bacterium]
MRLLGHILMWAGVLLASFFSVAEIDGIAWEVYVGSLALGLVGVALLRKTAATALHQEHRINEDLATMRAALSNVVRVLEELVAEGDLIEVYAVKDRIDGDMSEALASFADARESMIPAFGLTAYAEVMTRFAGGERLVNRAWSASADGYLDEVVACLRDALGQLSDAKGRYDQYSRDRADGRAPA